MDRKGTIMLVILIKLLRGIILLLLGGFWKHGVIGNKLPIVSMFISNGLLLPLATNSTNYPYTGHLFTITLNITNSLAINNSW